MRGIAQDVPFEITWLLCLARRVPYYPVQLCYISNNLTILQV